MTMTSLARYTDADLDLDLRWWAAANFLTVGQIYLQANPLLREPLRREHIKPRLLGHWGTSPGLSMIYTLLNRRDPARPIPTGSTSPDPDTADRPSWPTATWRARTARSTPGSARTSTDCFVSSASSRPRAAFPVT